MNTLQTISEIPVMDIEDRIRAAAHQLWEDEGRPEGCADDHWRRACEMIAAQDQADVKHNEPEWLQRNPEIEEALPAEKSDLSRSVDEIKKRLIGRAA
jgi:Protein of unknown function (DUF2934)